ncbi:MAG TPA: R3H domain-containing nucleic acid-binding protein [Candidatus Moranbacteria bacterium]|nr:R3H domain-containing nucleic acid-binding protein [Candidatus Moranbacteria bacterium]
MEKNNEDLEMEKKIKRIIEEMISKMGFKGSVEIIKKEEGEKKSYVCNVKTQESNFLIGQYGINLQSLQHIARMLVRKEISERINFIIDINSYRMDKNDSIVKLAKNLAEEALQEKKAVVLRPMGPYERRIVHLELAKDDRIKTESIGEGEDRRVVIKPIDLI